MKILTRVLTQSCAHIISICCADMALVDEGNTLTLGLGFRAVETTDRSPGIGTID